MKKHLREISLPDDVLRIKVLPLLPIVSLCRFKCVCKDWQRFISKDVISICTYSSPATIYYPSLELVLLSNGKPQKVSISSLLPLRHPIVSTNGLLCYPDPHSTGFCITNPATQQRTIIPNPKQRKRHLVGLAFDPSNPTQRFDLVCPYINSRMQGEEYRFEVFSSDTGVWRASQAKLIDNSEIVYLDGRVFAGGILYWKCCYGMMWLDIGKDIAGTVKWPPEKASVATEKVIGEFGDLLTAIEIKSDETIEIWIMREFQWHKMHCLTLNMVFGEENFVTIAPYCHLKEFSNGRPYDNLFHRFRLFPLPFGGGGVVYFKMEGQIFGYDMRTGRLIHVCCGWPVWFLYKRSLVALPQVKVVDNINFIRGVEKSSVARRQLHFFRRLIQRLRQYWASA